MIRAIEQEGVTVIELDVSYDSLDDAALDQLGEILLSAAGEGDRPAVLVDLSNTRFIGSRFIGLLVRAWKRVQDRGGQMGLCCIPSLCREALVSTRLYDTLWTPYETREQAVSAMK